MYIIQTLLTDYEIIVNKRILYKLPARNVVAI